MFKKGYKDIAISILPRFMKMEKQKTGVVFRFKLIIEIENDSAQAIQLASHLWKILDSLGKDETYLYDDALKHLLIRANEKIVYAKDCCLRSSIGTVSGSYTFINPESKTAFVIDIPNIYLQATISKN